MNDIIQDLLDKVREAEQLVTYVQMHGDPEKSLAAIRWLVVADEATGLLLQVKEHIIDPVALALIRDEVNAIKPGHDLWAKYEENPRRARAFFGRELHEQA
jgi:hypothetical protein